MTTTCRKCAAFEREAGKPRVCPECLPAFTARLVREGTPQAVYRYPEEVLGDDSGVRRIKRAARNAARLSTASSSPRDRDRVSRLSRDERRKEAKAALRALDECLREEHEGRLGYWATVTMISGGFDGATGQGGVWAAASRLVNERARQELRRRGDAWRAAGLGPFATLEAVREAGLEA